MSEVLSQSQIDALLNAARSGADINKTTEEPEQNKLRKYDFKSPRKFTKDRIKMLDGVFENYVRNINSRLNALLRTNCEIELESAEEQRYYEFSNALSEGDVITLSYITYENHTEPLPILLYISTPLMLSMIDRMLGGFGAIDESLDVDYSMTSLELKIYETIMRTLISNMGESWSNYIDLKFKFGRVETNPTLMQPLSLDETVVLMNMQIKFPNCDGNLTICLPGMNLSNLFREIDHLNMAPTNEDEETRRGILDSIQDTKIELVGEMCHTQLSFGDVYHLHKGDVIDLNRPKDSPFYISIGGKRWFEGKMGVYNTNIAIKLERIYSEPQGGDEKLK